MADRLQGIGELGTEPLWPVTNGRRAVFLLDASSSLEKRLLRDWIEHACPEGVAPADVDAIPIPPSRRKPRRPRLDRRLESRLAAGDDPLLAPLRVAWLPRLDERGEPAFGIRDLVFFGDPRDPGPLRQAWVLRNHPERCCIVAGEPAPLSEVRERWRRAGGMTTGETTGLAEFVARQAGLALERAERRLRGTRYKVPRFVHEDILARPAFRGGIERLARQLGRSATRVMSEASRDLREIAATHSLTMIDLVARLFRALSTRGYGKDFHYDRSQLREIAALSQRHPVVFLPTHKSNLDHPVLHLLLYENGLPPNHTAGGINMNFFPLGPLVRRAGVFFIRRSFKDDEIYKFVLRHYIDYLVEKRFSLEWYLEGGRSRSGKLLPPRFGLLAYVVDAYRRGKSDDVYLIPISIAYDQIQDVADYLAEESGQKERESFGWFLRVARRLRRRYGNIHLRFGEPLSLAKVLGPSDPDAKPNPDESNLAVQKIAFEICVRINQVTPITPTSLVTLALLGVGARALTVKEIHAALRNLLDYVRRRSLSTTSAFDLDTDEGVQRCLDALVQNGVVTCFAEGPEAVYAIGPERHLTAAYYRNTIIHFFVTGAIAELAILHAAEQRVADARAALFEEALRLRDLLKFEFFFVDRESFRAELAREIALHDAEWERRLEQGGPELLGLLRSFRPFSAHRVLRPFLEAYRVVGDALGALPTDKPFEEASFLSSCQALARQYVLQHRIRSAESVSRVLFKTALRLARNHELIEGEGAELSERRQKMAAEIGDAIRRIDAIEALAAARRSGVID
jgi:glycerol-3-phosphate O-acyltransferase